MFIRFLPMLVLRSALMSPSSVPNFSPIRVCIRVLCKYFNNDNEGIWCRLVLAQNSSELSLLKFLPLTYHHSHFLAATLDFTSFFIIACLRAALFLQLGCFGLDFTSFCICITQSWPMANFRAFFNLSFFLYHRKKKRWSRVISL